ncbi:MAG TPA: GatB/YqeY domain-containing protein [Blastocatellia bacterium]|nr:GatB/YqeY domain-containing protein [Blastocatellia bacterium]
MSEILTRVEAEITAAMKAKQADRLSALRMMKTALANRQIENRENFTDADAIKTLQTLAKQRRESADAFRAGGREAMAVKEEAELLVIEEYLPAAATAEDIEAAVAEAIAETGATSARDIGKVMPAAMKRLAGKTVDGKAVNAAVRARLGN